MDGLVILGAGYLGQRLHAAFPGSVLPSVDVTRPDDLARVFSGLRPRFIVNAAGKTGKPNVDWCETHQKETYDVNVVGALRVAEAAAAVGAHLVHIGSGCVFYGPCPYHPGGWREDDHANPSAFYSRTKYAAELLLAPLPDVCVARIRMPLDGAPSARNLISKLVSFQEVADVENSVTVVDDFLHAVRQLIERRATGIFHVTNPGLLRHRDVLALYRERVDPTHTAKLITADELIARGLALRPRSNCELASPRLAALGIRLRPIELALRETMEAYARNLAR